MKFTYGYKCAKCGALYPDATKYNLPCLCENCGEDLILYRREFSYDIHTGEKYYGRNIWFGYDGTEAEITPSAVRVKMCKAGLFSGWKVCE